LHISYWGVTFIYFCFLLLGVEFGCLTLCQRENNWIDIRLLSV